MNSKTDKTLPKEEGYGVITLRRGENSEENQPYASVWLIFFRYFLQSEDMIADTMNNRP